MRSLPLVMTLLLSSTLLCGCPKQTKDANWAATGSFDGLIDDWKDDQGLVHTFGRRGGRGEIVALRILEPDGGECEVGSTAWEDRDDGSLHVVWSCRSADGGAVVTWDWEAEFDQLLMDSLLVARTPEGEDYEYVSLSRVP